MLPTNALGEGTLRPSFHSPRFHRNGTRTPDSRGGPSNRDGDSEYPAEGIRVDSLIRHPHAGCWLFREPGATETSAVGIPVAFGGAARQRDRVRE